MRPIEKALLISLLIHLALIISLAVFPFVLTKKHYTPVYQVSLISQPEPKQKETTVTPEKKKPPVKKPTRVEKKAAPPKKKEKKKTVERKDNKEKRSLTQVQRAIDDIKKKMASQQKVKEAQARTSRIVEAKRNAYFDTIATHIQANWSLLKNQMEDVGILTTDVGLQIRRDGTITKIVIEKPSGNVLFDEFAVRAVKRSVPLPPFPKEMKEAKLEVTIGLSS